MYLYSLFGSVLFVVFAAISALENGVCDKDRLCSSKPSLIPTGFIFYDVNPPEGFNLRRDVYMRMAIMAKKLAKVGNWYLVLPPWPHLYHWQSKDVSNQGRIAWNHFFDVKSLAAFAPVMEMTDFFKIKLQTIDQVFVLQHFQDTFTSHNFNDRSKIEPCLEDIEYHRSRDGKGYSGDFWGYSNITATKVDCLSFHGHAEQLIDIIQATKQKTIMFDHAEIVLHDRFGDKTYWEARRSMKFAEHLIQEAVKFQIQNRLNTSSNTGSPYLCAHLRRKDFLRGRHKQIPSLKGAAQQITEQLDELKVDTVFIATDAPSPEKTELRTLLKEYTVIFYEPSHSVKNLVKDGGVAIIDQIVCSNARKFIGSYESTFSFRIQEERELLGFSPETTFVRFCGDFEQKCKQPSQWRIVH